VMKLRRFLVIPAKAGIQAERRNGWTPACAGVTRCI